MKRKSMLQIMVILSMFLLVAPIFSAAIPMARDSQTKVERTFTITSDVRGGAMSDGIPVTGSLSSVGQTELWYINVGANCISMYSVLTCGSADFDLYGRLGAAPTTSTYDWRGYTYGGEEVTYNNPGAGTWYIMVRDYSGSGSYTLTVTLTYDGGGGGDNELESGVTETSSLPARYSTEMWYIEVGTNCESMYSELTCGSADFDLYGRLGAEPTTSTYDWRGYTSGGEEVTYNNPRAGTWYIMVRSYSGSGPYSLTVTLTYGGGDTTAPSVSITSPSSGATVSDTTTISFTASDTNGISSRRILIDGAQVSTSSSYNWDTTGYSDGTHTIRCEATDPSGNTGYDQISVTVDNSGGGDNELESGVTETSSLAAQYDTEMWFIQVDANCESMYSVLTCGSADFDLYGRLGAEPTTSTYDWRGYTGGGEEVTYNNPGAGTWFIMVRSYSGTGSYGLTVTLTYSGPDTIPPSVSINSPADGATVSGTVSISFSATDDNGISSRRILVDGAQVSTSSSYNWDTTGYADGSTHTIRCEATDPSGNTGYDVHTVTVDNSGGGGGDGVVTKWAVIVGISDYQAISDLSYCDEDATDWYNYLHNVMDYDNIRVLGDGHTSNYPSYYADANEYNVKASLSWMISGADEDDQIAFITSGHGSGDGYGSSYLCMWDCSSGDNGEDGNLWDTELASIFSNAVAGDIFIFIDHCYSGGLIPEIAALSINSHVYMTTTCTDDGYGYDDSAHQNGAWTYYFLQYGLINHYGSNPNTLMEDCFDYALAAYPYGGGDTPQEFDGNTSSGFKL
ncbi:MAG: Ig-like domain-containing protein [Candidatus Thorarchaeota archaeon]